MRTAYPAAFTKIPEGYMVSVPDFDINTHGADLGQAIFMARDAIGLSGLCLIDDRKPLPAPSSLESIEHEDGDILSMVDIDFKKYRRANELRMARSKRFVRRKVSIPRWLNKRAKKAGLDVSAILQSALSQKLHALNTSK